MPTDNPRPASPPRLSRSRPTESCLAERGMLAGLIALAALTAGATMGEKPSDVRHRIDRQIAAQR